MLRSSLAFSATVVALSATYSASNLPLDQLVLPPGFKIEVYADGGEFGFTEPRVLRVQTASDGSTLVYFGTTDASDPSIKVLIDSNNDNIPDKISTVFTGQPTMLASLAIDENDGNRLYAAQYNVSYQCEGDVNEQVVQGDLPLTCQEWFPIFGGNLTAEFHELHYMQFAPSEGHWSGKLCIAFGTPCNECIPYYPVGTLQCYDTNNTTKQSDGQVIATGIRNVVGFDWHPQSKEMFFTDNGRDDIGDNPDSDYDTENHPDCELNYLSDAGNQNFGYPYCHSGGNGDPYYRDAGSVYAIEDPDLGSGDTDGCSKIGNDYEQGQVTLAHQPLGPHIAPLGMRFYEGSMFPDYQGSILIAEHGSWDRTPIIGYRVMRVVVDSQQNMKVLKYEPFIEGWLNNSTQSYWGRPADVESLPDGSLLVSDDYAHVIYRVTYDGDGDK